MIRLRREGYPPKRNSRPTRVLMADRAFFFRRCQNVGHMPLKMTAPERKKRDPSTFWSVIVILVK